MSIIHKVTRQYQDEAGISITATETPTGSGSMNVSQSYADSSTNVAVADFKATRAALLSVVISSDHAITLKTNSSGSPTDTLSIAAGQVWIWTLAQDGLGKCPFSADVTALFVTNASGFTAKLEIRMCKTV